jgi:hypothetical protein
VLLEGSTGIPSRSAIRKLEIGSMLDRCTHCGTTILFGGVKEDGLSFCNKKCREAGAQAIRA